VGINRLFYRCTAPCNYGFNDSLCDFVGINRLFYSSTAPCNYGFIDSLWAKLGSPIYRFLQAELKETKALLVKD
jgi:inorganic pyrophosphatase